MVNDLPFLYINAVVHVVMVPVVAAAGSARYTAATLVAAGLSLLALFGAALGGRS